MLAASAMAQTKIEIPLRISHIPKDGLIFAQVPLGNFKNTWKNASLTNYRTQFRANNKTFETQLIPRPGFGESNYFAMLLIDAPGQQQLTGTLELTPATVHQEKVLADSYTVSTSAARWTFTPQKTSIFPSQVTITGSGTSYSGYSWDDRVYSKTLQSFQLANDKSAELRIISDGPIATILRGKAQYFNSSQKKAPGDPQAIYDWYFFKDSPLVFLDAVESEPSPSYAWDQLHSFEWNFKKKYFSGYMGDESETPKPLTDNKSTYVFSKWGAFVSQHDAIAYVGGAARLYDGDNSFGKYIRPNAPAPWKYNWNGESRRMTQWLWVSDFTTSAQLSATLNKVANAAAGRIAESNVSVIYNQKISAADFKTPPSLSGSANDANWFGSIVKRKLLLGKTLQPASWHFVKSGNLGLTLDITNAGVRLVSLYDLQKQQELAADTSSPLFILQLFNPQDKKYLSIDAETGWKSTFMQKTPDGFSLTFKRDVQGKPIAVTVNAIAAANDSAWEWTIDIDNKNSGWSVQNVFFPQVKLRHWANNLAAFVPASSGKVEQNPIINRFGYDGTYPSGTQATMQYMAIYQTSDNPTGLYVARHDPVASYKTLHLQTESITNTVALSFDQMAENPQTAGNVFHYQGTGVWKLLNGDWYDAARYYKNWAAHNASWWPEINNNGRVDTPDWYKKLDFAITLATRKDMQSTTDEILKMKDFIGLPMLDHWYQWHGNPFDNDYPHYFPSKPGFKDAVQRVQQNDVHVMPYINGRLWDTRDKGLEDFEFTKKALPWATKIDKDGKLVPDTESYRSTESDGSKVLLAVMCPYTTFWQNTITNVVKKLTTEVGVDGVYIDQIGASRPVPCMDPTHGHPLGGGHWWVDGYDAMLRQIQETIPADKIITTEDNAEPYMKYLDGMLSWMWIDEGQVPAYSVVYGSAVQCFGRSYNAGDTSIRMKAGQELTFGEQIGWINPGTFFGNNTNDATRQYFKQVIHVRDKISPYIYAGEMQRPPQLSNNPPITANWGRNGLVTTDSVLTAAWKKYGEKKIAIVFTNVSDKPLILPYHFNPAEYGIPAQEYEITQWNSTQLDNEQKIQTGKSTFDLSLPGLSTIVWEISWK